MFPSLSTEVPAVTSAEGGISLARVMGITTSTNVSRVGVTVWVICGAFEMTDGDRDTLAVWLELAGWEFLGVSENSEVLDVAVMKVVGVRAVVVAFRSPVMADSRVISGVGVKVVLSRISVGVVVFVDVGISKPVRIVEFWPTLDGSGVGRGAMENVAVLSLVVIDSEVVVIVKLVAGETAAVVALVTIVVLAVIIVLATIVVLVIAVRTGATGVAALGGSGLLDDTGSGFEVVLEAAGPSFTLGEAVCGITGGPTVVKIGLSPVDVVEILDSVGMPVVLAPDVVVVVPMSTRIPVASVREVFVTVSGAAGASVASDSEMVVETPDSVGMPVAPGPGAEVRVPNSVRLPVTSVVTVPDVVEIPVASSSGVVIETPDSVGILGPRVVIVVPDGVGTPVTSGSKVVLKIPDSAGISVAFRVVFEAPDAVGASVALDPEVVEVSDSVGMSVASGSGTVVGVPDSAGMPVVSVTGVASVLDTVEMSVVAGSGAVVEVPDPGGVPGSPDSMGVVTSGIAADVVISVIIAAAEVGLVAAIAVGVVIPPTCG